LGRGVVDRSCRVEGAEVASVWLLLRRRSAWAGWLALARRPITFDSEHLADLARVMQDTSQTVSVCSAVLTEVADELRSRDLAELAETIEGVTVLLGWRQP
jgi:hypothetical protein